tara:strand:+ start:2530 stop:4854 length:2325 start_codon:yes stop_codon:yes gene_type:complete
MASFKGFVEGLTGVASEVGSHLLDPSGKKRGTVAYEELMNSMQPALAKEVLDYERNTRFWVEHDAMLKRTKRSATDWRNAKLENELLILKDFYKDTDYTFDIAAEKNKLKNSPEFQARLDQYEDLMNKGKRYEITIEDLSTEKGRELNRAKHIGPIQARMEALAREIYKNYGLKGDIKAILGNMGIGKGDQRSLTETPLGDTNFNVLLPEAADSIELKRLNSIVKAIEGEGISNIDLQLMRATQEGITVDPTLTLRDPVNISKLLINTRTEGVINGFYNVQASPKDSSFPQVPDSEKIQIGKDLETPAEVLHTLYNQSNAGLSAEQGGNAFADIKADHQQIAALIANIGTSEDYKINIVENYSKISMTAWDIIKDRITQNKIDSADPADYVRGSNRLMYTPLDNNEKLNLIAKMPEILESLGGKKTQISKFVPELKKAMKQSLGVTNLKVVQDAVKAIREGDRFTSQSEAIDMINYINNPESEFKELSESEREYLSEEVTNKFKSERDPFFTPTQELGSDFYSRRLQEDIDSGEFNNITQEVGPIPKEEKENVEDIISRLPPTSREYSSLLEKDREEESINLTVATDMNNSLIEKNKTWDVASVGIENVDTAFNTVFLDLLAKMESDNRNIGQVRNKSTASGYYQMTKAAVQEAIKNIPNVEELHPEVIESLNKSWIKGKNNLEDVNKSTQAKLALTYLFNLKVSGKAGRGDTYIKEFTQAYLDNNYSEMANIWKNFYSEGWHTLDKKTKKLPLNVSNRLEEITTDYFKKYTGI